MQAFSQSAGNRGNIGRNAQGGESLRRSARSMPTVPEETKKEGEERSPMLLLARRIREEQGAEGLKAFLFAMEPFAAPYELKSLAERFGIERSLRENTAQNGGAPNQNAAFSAFGGGFSTHNNAGFNMNGMNSTGGMNGAQPNNMGIDPNMIRMMQMMNGAGNNGGMNSGVNGGMNGGNMNQMMQLMQVMRLLPMLQNMGKGGADISQIIKMMNM